MSALQNNRLADGEISFLSKGDREATSQKVQREEAEAVPAEVGRTAAKGLAGGAEAGGPLGWLRAGPRSQFPESVPRSAREIWAAGGAAAGATAGGVAKGITKMWEGRYRDHVFSVLVGVHTRNPNRPEVAAGCYCGRDRSGSIVSTKGARTIHER